MTDLLRKPKLAVPDLARKKAAGERLSMVAVADAVSIFTFSIGAGSAAIATKALAAYVDDVASGAFPDEEHSYGMDPDEAAALADALRRQPAKQS